MKFRELVESEHEEEVEHRFRKSFARLVNVYQDVADIDANIRSRDEDNALERFNDELLELMTIGASPAELKTGIMRGLLKSMKLHATSDHRGTDPKFRRAAVEAMKDGMTVMQDHEPAAAPTEAEVDAIAKSIYSPREHAEALRDKLKSADDAVKRHEAQRQSVRHELEAHLDAHPHLRD